MSSFSYLVSMSYSKFYNFFWFVMYRIFLLFFCTVVGFVIGACASGPPVSLSEKDVSPVMIDASIIITIKEPFISILLDLPNIYETN